MGAGLLAVKSGFILFIKSFVYYESIKRELKIRGINKCRCDERLKKNIAAATQERWLMAGMLKGPNNWPCLELLFFLLP